MSHQRTLLECELTIGSGAGRDGLVDAVVASFCLGETFAVPLFNAMREHTTFPLAKRVLERVLRDEAIHRQFGWDALDALLEIDADEKVEVSDRLSVDLVAAQDELKEVAKTKMEESNTNFR